MPEITQHTIPTPDAFFWYFLCVLLVIIVGWGSNRYFRKQDAREELQNKINYKLTKMLTEHHVRIETIEEDLANLQGVPRVKYKSNENPL